MNEKSLEKNLANLERELVNLQTAHEIGLGVVEYYEYNEQPTNFYENDVYYSAVLAEVKQGEKIWPFYEYWGVDKGIDDIAWEQSLVKSDGKRFALFTISFYDVQDKIRIISTSQLNIHFASSVQEIRDWVEYYD